MSCVERHDLNAQTDLDERMGKVLETWRVPIIEPEYAAYEK